jgi:glycosyltransferase involved in cell wall biosynthesis
MQNKKIHILLVIHDNELSGATSSLFDWIENLDLNQVNISVFVPFYRVNDQLRKNSKRINFIFSNYLSECSNRNEFVLSSYLKYFIKKTINFFLYYRILAIIKQLKIDVIHSNSLAVTLGARLAKSLSIKHVWHVREFFEEDHNLTYLNKKFFKQIFYDSYPIYISNSIKDKYSLINSKGIMIYDQVKYQNHIKTRQFMQDGFCNLIIVGSLTHGKQQTLAIKAIQLLVEMNYDVKLFIYGSGPLEKHYKKLISQLNLTNHVFLKGYVKEINQERLNMDIGLMCSEKEALGRVTIEGMYYGNLMICNKSGSNLEIIQNSLNGFLYEKNSVKDLVKKIKYVIDNPSKFNEVIRYAYDYSLDNFSHPISSKIEKFYSNVISDNN